MKKILLFLILVVTSACTSQNTKVDELLFANIVQGTVRGMETWGTAWGPDAFQSSGERIYFTTINQENKFLTYSGGPSSDMMMGGFLACASCHGPTGRGGIHKMYNYTMVAPDIRYTSLNVQKQSLFDSESTSSSGENNEYSIEDLHLALVEGKRLDGSSLNEYMPRWELSDQDLSELLDYLKTLP